MGRPEEASETESKFEEIRFAWLLVLKAKILMTRMSGIKKFLGFWFSPSFPFSLLVRLNTRTSVFTRKLFLRRYQQLSVVFFCLEDGFSRYLLEKTFRLEW